MYMLRSEGVSELVKVPLSAKRTGSAIVRPSLPASDAVTHDIDRVKSGAASAIQSSFEGDLLATLQESSVRLASGKLARRMSSSRKLKSGSVARALVLLQQVNQLERNEHSSFFIRFRLERHRRLCSYRGRSNSRVDIGVHEKAHLAISKTGVEKSLKDRPVSQIAGPEKDAQLLGLVHLDFFVDRLRPVAFLHLDTGALAPHGVEHDDDPAIDSLLIEREAFGGY